MVHWSIWRDRSAIISGEWLGGCIPPKQGEAREYVSSINKGQQAYFAEKSVFSTSVKALGIGIKTETENYKYSHFDHKKSNI
jgi:type IV pilus assembly protein PilA